MQHHSVTKGRTLKSGTPFSGRLRNHVDAVLGDAFTPAGLAAFCAPVYPEGTWAVDDCWVGGMYRAGFAVMLRCYDPQEQFVMQCGIGFFRHADSTLEVHGFDLYVAPTHRRRGLASSLVHKGYQLAQILTAPRGRACLTLCAGTLDGPQSASRCKDGIAFFARGRTFSFARGFPSGFAAHEELEIVGHDAMADAFWRWAATHLNARHDRQKLQAAVAACREPGDFWHLRIEGITCRDGHAALGQAFLASPMAPTWQGLLWVEALRAEDWPFASWGTAARAP